MPDAAEAGPAEGPVPGTEAEAKSAEPAETEVFFVFTRGQRRRQPRRDTAPGQTKGGRAAGHAGAGPGGKRNAGKGHGRKPKPGNDAPRPDKPRAPRPEKKIDPDNPFAALLALKTDT
jgi:ATP-dependent RNA helicase SUPV3L1/SUV3